MWENVSGIIRKGVMEGKFKTKTSTVCLCIELAEPIFDCLLSLHILYMLATWESF